MSLPERPLGEAIRLTSSPVTIDAEQEYRIAGIYSFGRGLIKRPTIKGRETSYKTLTRLHAGQLAMSKLNAREGALAIVPEEFSGAHVSPEYPVFDIDTNIAEPAYIAHLVKWPALWERLTPRGSMVRRTRTAPSTLMATTVPLPGLDEQKRIATYLDTATTKLTTINIAHGHAEELRKAVLHCLISKAGNSRQLGEILRYAVSEEPVQEGRNYPIAGVYGFGRGLFKRGPIRGDETSYQKLNRLTSGRLVMSRLKAFEGALAIIPPDFDGWYLSPEFPTFDIDTTQADERYLANICSWPALWTRLNSQSKGIGARKVRVSVNRLLSVSVPLPTLEEQRRTANLLDKLQQSKALTTCNNTHLQALNSALLTAAFNGQSKFST